MRFDPVGTGESHSCLQRWPRLRWSTSRSTHLNRSRCTFTGHLSLPADIGFPSSGGASGGPPLFVLFCYVMFLFVVFFSFPSFVVLLYIYIFFFILSNFLSLPPPRLFASVCCYPADFICCRCRCFLFSRRNRLGIFNGTSCHSKIYFYTFHWLWPWLLLKHHSRKPKGGWTSSWVSLQREKNRLVVVVVDFRVVVSIRYFHRHWFHH